MRSAAHTSSSPSCRHPPRRCRGSCRRTGTPPGTRSPAAPCDRRDRCRRPEPTSPPASSTSVLLPAPVGPTTATMRPDRHPQVDVVAAPACVVAGERERDVVEHEPAVPGGAIRDRHRTDRPRSARRAPRGPGPIRPTSAAVARQRVADQAQREHEQREQVDEAGELADGDVAAASTRIRPDHDEGDVGERRAARRAPTRTCPAGATALTRASRSRPAIVDRRSVSRCSAPYALTSCTPSKLSWTPADSCPSSSWARVEVPVDAMLVDDVEPISRIGNIGDRDGAEHEVGGEQPHRRDDDHQHRARWRTGSARARRSRRRCRRRRGRRGRRRGGAGATRSAGARGDRPRRRPATAPTAPLRDAGEHAPDDDAAARSTPMPDRHRDQHAGDESPRSRPRPPRSGAG